MNKIIKIQQVYPTREQVKKIEQVKEKIATTFKEEFSIILQENKLQQILDIKENQTIKITITNMSVTQKRIEVTLLKKQESEGKNRKGFIAGRIKAAKRNNKKS